MSPKYFWRVASPRKQEQSKREGSSAEGAHRLFGWHSGPRLRAQAAGGLRVRPGPGAQRPRPLQTALAPRPALSYQLSHADWLTHTVTQLRHVPCHLHFIDEETEAQAGGAEGITPGE